jgi:predicted heme/steroid binding protein
MICDGTQGAQMKKYLVLLSLLVLLTACTATPKVNTDPETTDQTGDQTLTEYNTTSLAEFNGKNGAKAYIAVSGKVYDVTNVSEWKNGAHNGYVAGVDLTAAFAKSPHSDAFLATIKLVGTFVK